MYPLTIFSPREIEKTMTEKEIKKLSRLELLELLLEASSENQKLKNHIEKLQIDLENAHSIQHLSAAIDQVEKVLARANRIVNTNGTITPPSNNAVEEDVHAPLNLLDKQIYAHLLAFYADNASLLTSLPLELQIAIKERIPSVLNK